MKSPTTRDRLRLQCITAAAGSRDGPDTLDALVLSDGKKTLDAFPEKTLAEDAKLYAVLCGIPRSVNPSKATLKNVNCICALKITSNFDIESESLHQVTKDRETGETKVTDIQEPHRQTISSTITSNPVKYEAKGTEEPKVTEGEEVKVNPATIGYDTS